MTFCTTCYNADIPPKTTQIWMGHADTKLVMDVYTKLTVEKEQADALRLNRFLCRLTTKGQETGEEQSDQTLVG